MSGQRAAKLLPRRGFSVSLTNGNALPIEAAHKIAWQVNRQKSWSNIMTMGKFLLGWLGISTVCALGAHYIYPTRDGLADKLTAKANAVKDSVGADWATIDFKSESPFRYRIARITGAAPSEEAKTQLRDEILAKHGRFAFDGGIHDVRFVDSPVATYEMKGEIVGGDLVLTGEVPDAATKAAVVEKAKATFVNPALNIVDKLTVANVAPPAMWADAAAKGFADLKALGNGNMTLDMKTLTVSGEAADQATADTLTADLQDGVDGGFDGRSLITAKGMAPAAPAPAPEVQQQVDTCKADMDAVMANKTIEFATGKAVIRETPNPILDKLADVAAKCPDARIEVGGHTDKTGNPASNMTLSQARAEAVVSYLAAKGIATDRLTAKGYGPDQPLDPADTPAAYQKNRRIEFNVSAATGAQ
jgi:OmpA-OmpF porin, OOP family